MGRLSKLVRRNYPKVRSVLFQYRWNTYLEDLIKNRTVIQTALSVIKTLQSTALECVAKTQKIQSTYRDRINRVIRIKSRPSLDLAKKVKIPCFGLVPSHTLDSIRNLQYSELTIKEGMSKPNKELFGHASPPLTTEFAVHKTQSWMISCLFELAQIDKRLNQERKWMNLDELKKLEETNEFYSS